jgi:hypothetical protein
MPFNSGVDTIAVIDFFLRGFFFRERGDKRVAVDDGGDGAARRGDREMSTLENRGDNTIGSVRSTTLSESLDNSSLDDDSGDSGLIVVGLIEFDAKLNVIFSLHTKKKTVDK